MNECKVTKLAPGHITALLAAREAGSFSDGQRLTVTRTTATFVMPNPYEWLQAARVAVQEVHGMRYDAPLRRVLDRLAVTPGGGKRSNRPARSQGAPKALRDLLRLDS